MTDRFHSLTVVLETDLREDDAEAVMAAIAQLRGVIQVTGMVADPAAYMAEQRAKRDLRLKILELL